MAVAVGAVEADQGERLVDATPALGPVAAADDVERLADDLGDRAVAVEGAQRVLERQLHLAAATEVAQRPSAEAGELVTVEGDRAGGRLDQSDGRPGERGLP